MQGLTQWSRRCIDRFDKMFRRSIIERIYRACKFSRLLLNAALPPTDASVAEAMDLKELEMRKILILAILLGFSQV